MLQLTIRQAYRGDFDPQLYTDDHVLYLFREGETVFYVGHSDDPLRRFHEHLATDMLGDLIKMYRPESLDWQFEMLTFADCAHLYTAKCPLYPADKSDREYVEVRLIQHYRPCLNRSNNLNGKPLPEKYRGIYRLEVGLTDNLY